MCRLTILTIIRYYKDPLNNNQILVIMLTIETIIRILLRMHLSINHKMWVGFSSTQPGCPQVPTNYVDTLAGQQGVHWQLWQLPSTCCWERHLKTKIAIDHLGSKMALWSPWLGRRSPDQDPNMLATAQRSTMGSWSTMDHGDLLPWRYRGSQQHQVQQEGLPSA